MAKYLIWSSYLGHMTIPQNWTAYSPVILFRKKVKISYSFPEYQAIKISVA